MSHRDQQLRVSESGIRQRWLLRTTLGAFILAGILFLGAGTARWIAAWIYLASIISIGVATAFLLDPSLLAERSTSRHPDQKPWDRTLFALYGLVNGLLVPLLAALNVRFSWPPPIPAWFQFLALIPCILGWALGLWAMVSNTFFAEVVRIQRDRGQIVVTSGPYAIVRHPGYLGGAASLLFTPLILGSFWSFLVAALGVALLILRTALEDQALTKELEGYSEYARSVRYRLVPGLW